jgi:hypothetical protein
MEIDIMRKALFLMGVMIISVFIQADAEDKIKWIEFRTAGSVLDDRIGVYYLDYASLIIYEDGNWICSVKHKALRAKGGSFDIEAKGSLRESAVKELQNILKDTDAINAKDVEGSQIIGNPNQGLYSRVTSTILIHNNGNTYKIIWPGFGTVHDYTTATDVKKDKHNIKGLFRFLLWRIPFLA